MIIRSYLDEPATSVIRLKAEKDPGYRPYCLRCRDVVRMVIVEPFLWKCDQCGAIHDERSKADGTN